MKRQIEAPSISQEKNIALVQDGLNRLSHHTLHLKAKPSTLTVNEILTNVQKTRNTLNTTLLPDHPFAYYAHAHLGSHILHTAYVAKTHGIFSEKQAEGYFADGHQEADRALSLQQQSELGKPQQTLYTTNTLQTLQDIIPLIGPLPTEQRTFFEFVFEMEKQRFAQFADKLQGSEKARQLIEELSHGFAFYEDTYKTMPKLSPRPPQDHSPETGPLRRQYLEPLPSPAYPFLLSPMQQEQFSNSYPAYPRHRHEHTQPRTQRYHPTRQPTYEDSWPYQPEVTREESLGLPRFGPPRRNPS